MKIVVKRLGEDAQWKPIKIDEILGQSVCSFMIASKEKMIAAIYEGEEPIAFMSNDDEYVQTYKSRGLSISCKDMQALAGSDVVPSWIAKELAGSDLVEIITEDKDGHEQTG